MDLDTIDAIEEEEEALTRPSSWSAALSQLPGFPSEGMVAMPQAMRGAAREVTSALEEDLDDEPVGDEKELV